MKDLFVCLLLNLAHHGKITEANMYKGGDFSTVTLKTNNGIYRVSVTREKEKTEQDTDGNI